jgi:DNA polymerase III subunit delta'
MFEGIVGHEKQRELLSKALEKNKLSHAYVFAGPESIGKKLLAKKIAWKLLEGEKEFHPDLIELAAEDGIKIDQIRELAYKLSLKPYQAKYKVALIDNAESMTTEAANALLKTLEEPKDYTYIFLITSNPNRLPKTILSRAQKINFGPIKGEGVSSKEEGLENSEVFFQTFLSEDLAERLISAYEIADLETEEIKQLLDFWLNKLEQKLLLKASKNIAKKTAAVLSARKFLDQNVNSKLLLTNLMLST